MLLFLTGASFGAKNRIQFSARCASDHSFRSTFRDWAAKKTSTSREMAEAALVHMLDNKADAAYRRIAVRKAPLFYGLTGRPL
jgi:hypothetical protein